mmetsp:Transcript_70900/g.160410  ORF Transcript_70900/g.160410 Transcript_70900/m.160410 type:complete len:219 (-) Transcript_70900:1063-1719(-)
MVLPCGFERLLDVLSKDVEHGGLQSVRQRGMRHQVIPSFDESRHQHASLGLEFDPVLNRDPLVKTGLDHLLQRRNHPVHPNDQLLIGVAGPLAGLDQKVERAVHQVHLQVLHLCQMTGHLHLRDEEVAGELDKVHFCGVHWLGAQEALALQVVALAHLLEHEHGLPRVLKERPLLRAQVDELVEGLLFALLHNAHVLRQPRPEVEQELVLAVLLLHVL